ncbi:MAG: FAD-dependent oxidoreductase [Clostridia bacterium]|nr:FAD-dependent oxidoreductase [Clostridia bacterium]
MKKTTAIILLLVIMVIALGGALIYQMTKNNLNIIIVPSGDIVATSGEPNLPSGDEEEEDKFINESGEKLTQIEPETAIIEPEIEVKNKYDDVKVKESFDLIVFGAEPEGIATAIASSRLGLKTLLVEDKDGPGGLFTYGMLNTIDMNTGTNGEILNGGIFKEFYEKIGNKNTFDVNNVKKVLNDMINAEKNLKTMYKVKEIEVIIDDPELSLKSGEVLGEDEYRTIKYVMIDGKKYEALNYIDCTEDADITVAAGAKYTIGWEDINEKNRSMSATLVIRMENVDWKAMTDYIDKNKTSSSGYNDEAIWAFGEITQKYVPTQPHMRLKALNIGKQDDGSILINSLQIMDVDTLDETQKELAYKKSKKEAESFAKFLIENVPGFENAKFGGVADELYVRETRHIVGEQKLTVEDILLSKRSSKDVAMGSYAIDVQTTSIYDWGYIIANPKQYFIPFGCIIPKGYSNLLTCSRCASYSSIAAGSARVVPTGMSLGEAGAVASLLSKQRNINFQEIYKNTNYMTDLQDKIKLTGGIISKESKPILEKTNKNYSKIIEMCEKGILSLGYDNKFDSERIMYETEFIVLVKTYLKRSFIRDELWNTDHINLLDIPQNRAITPNRVKEIMYDITTYKIKDEDKKQDIEDFLNIVVPQSTEELTTSRVYEILIGFKDFIVREGL